MKILVINAGSSSLKYQLFDMGRGIVMAGGIVERIGEPQASLSHRVFIGGGEAAVVLEQAIAGHRDAMHLVSGLIMDRATGVIDRISDIDAIGHRVVQGGEAFTAATLIDASVKQAIQEMIPLAPLHNPANLTVIDVAEDLFPSVPNVAVFDTEFHQTMPARAFLYPLPHDFYTRYRVRRYGFHGTSHKYVAHEAARLMGKPIADLNIITVHLGNGCSMCAVEQGRCRDTTMGMTPLGGIMMGTRSGDLDPGIVHYLLDQTDMTMDHLESVLNRESGLKGICGMNDLRDIHEAVRNGDAMAALAVDMMAYQVRKCIGAYAAVLGRVDAVVFTAGIGENDAVIREKACENLGCLGVHMDLEKNSRTQPRPFSIHSDLSQVAVWVIATNEELQIARDVIGVLS